MHFDIQARGFPLTGALRAHVERRLRFALGSASARLHRLAVRLTDDNGPRGGLDKRCTLHASLPGERPVVVEQRDADLYAAIDMVADKLDRQVVKHKEKVSHNHHDKRQQAE